MKIIIIIFLCFLNNICLSQQKIEREFIKYETNEYYIKYYFENLNFNIITEKCENLGCEMFEIIRKDNIEKPKIPIIKLRIFDCTRLGIGTHSFEKELKNKDSNYTKVTTLDNYEFYEKKTKIDKFILVSYVHIKNSKVYTLECLTEMNDSDENNKEELIIMNTFRVK